MGRSTSFEVEVNGQLVYSKLRNMVFPKFGDIVKVCQEVEQGAQPRDVSSKLLLIAVMLLSCSSNLQENSCTRTAPTTCQSD